MTKQKEKPSGPRASASLNPKPSLPEDGENSASVITVVVKSVYDRRTQQSAWAAAISDDASPVDASSSNLIYSRCDAESAYDAEFLGCIAALDYLRQTKDGSTQQVELYASDGLASTVSRMKANDGLPTGKARFHDMLAHLYRLATELGANFQAIPKNGRVSALAERSWDAARDASGLNPRQEDQPAGIMKCLKPGCEVECNARAKPNGQVTAYCWRCKKQWFV